MRIDIIEVKPKSNRIRIVVIVMLVILFIASFSMFGMYYAKLYKSKLITDKKQDNISNQVINSEKQNKDTIYNIDDRESVKKALMPIYSENAKKEMNNIYNSNSKIAYLTFDDGPSQAVTPLILDLLKKENIKATFFVLGTNINKNQDIVKRAYLEGHYIANHGYTHSYSKLYKNAKTVVEEYNKTEKAIQNAIGNSEYSSHLFRFPGRF